MEPAPRGPMAFVGRERELDTLRTRLVAARAGRGGVVLIAGEPGIGKTRLVEELATLAAAQGAPALWGRCHEGEGAPAYWPWLQILRDYVAERDAADLRDELGPGAPDIAALLPELRLRLPDLPEPPSSGRGERGGSTLQSEAEQARFRLFHALSAFLKNAADADSRPAGPSLAREGAPPSLSSCPALRGVRRRVPADLHGGHAGRGLVLILDDLHRADAPSLLLLQFLAGELVRSRILVAGTYRDTEQDRPHPLTHALAAVARLTATDRIHLRGLAPQEVARFVEHIAGRPPSPALVAAVAEQTEGNPFFVGEVVRFLAAEGPLMAADASAGRRIAIPPSVREVIGLRIDQLSTACSTLLELAAVIGREFTLVTLARLASAHQGAPLTDGWLLELLHEAESARIVVAVPDALGRYRFAHALIRDTLYERLTAARRMWLHGLAGEALEGLYAADAGPHLAELAHHFFQAAPARGPAKAVDYAYRAGDRALALLAYEEGARHYAMALQALDLPQAADDRRRGELLLALGTAQNRAGDTEAALDTLRRAAEIARKGDATGRPFADLLARAALSFGRASAVTEDEAGKVRIDLLEEALTALGEGDSVLRARMLARLARALHYARGAGQRRAALSLEAVAMARRLGDEATLAYALNARHWALWGPDNVEERLAAATEIVRLAAAAGDRDLTLQGYTWRIADLLELGDLRSADGAIAARARLAEASRQPHYLWLTPLLAAMRAVLAGRFAEGERLATEALAIGRRAAGQNALHAFGVQMLIVRREQGRLGEVEATVRGFADQYPGLPIWRCTLAWLLAELGREAEARAEFEHLAAHDFVDIPRDVNWLVAVTALAYVCAALGDSRRAAILSQLLQPYVGHNVVASNAILCYGPVSWYVGLLATTICKGRSAGGQDAATGSCWEEAERQFGAALAMNGQLRAPALAARTQHDYAAMLLARGRPDDRERALTLLAQALDTALELDMARLVQQVEDLWHGVRRTAEAAPWPEPGTSGIASRGQRVALPAGLSPREGEVLGLLAAGRSNADIAKELVLSVHTVVRHVAHIYAKIGARGRADAIAFALRHGLK